METASPGIEEGRKYRFTVGSAEEAVRTIRHHLGAKAKVLSVRQVDGRGLARFIASPRLEVIAEIPSQTAPAATPPAPGKEPKGAESPGKQRERESASGGARPDGCDGQASEDFAHDSSLWSIMRRAGFPENLIASMAAAGDTAWDLGTMSVAHGLAEVSSWLRARYRNLPERPVGSRIAFFGTPGVGKTAALCKMLAAEVFLHRRPACVLKLDSDTPNPDDALRIFCDVLSVPLVRDPNDLDWLTEDSVLLLDLPGSDPDDRGEWRNVGARLDSLDVTTRVLVVNAAYDAEILKQATERARGRSYAPDHDSSR